MRFLTGSVRDWKFLVGEAYRCLKEDGILESSEPSFLIESDDGTVDERSAWNQWHGVFEEYGAHIGQTFSVVQEGIQRQALEEAHFSDIRELDYKVRIASLPSVLGEKLTFDLRYRLGNGQEIQGTDG